MVGRNPKVPWKPRQVISNRRSVGHGQHFHDRVNVAGVFFPAGSAGRTSRAFSRTSEVIAEVKEETYYERDIQIGSQSWNANS